MPCNDYHVTVMVYGSTIGNMEYSMKRFVLILTMKHFRFWYNKLSLSEDGSSSIS